MVILGDSPSEDAAAAIRLPPSAIAAAAARVSPREALDQRVIAGDLDIDRALRDDAYLGRVMAFLRPTAGDANALPPPNAKAAGEAAGEIPEAVAPPTCLI